MELKEIGPVSSAKVMGILYAAIGLIAGVLFACVAMAGAAMGNGFESTSPLLGAACSASAPSSASGVVRTARSTRGPDLLRSLQHHRATGWRDSGDASVARDDHAVHAASTAGAGTAAFAMTMR